MPKNLPNLTAARFGQGGKLSPQFPLELKYTVEEFPGIDINTANYLRQATIEVKKTCHSMMEQLVHVGKVLCEVKERTPRFFLKWLEQELKYVISVDTAENWMNVYKRLVENYGDKYSEELKKLQPTALYYLAREAHPEEFRVQVLESAKDTDKVIKTKDIKTMRFDYDQKIKEANLNLLLGAGVNSNIADKLSGTNIPQVEEELQKILNLPEHLQQKVADILVDQPKIRRVKDALKALETENKSKVDSPSSQIIDVAYISLGREDNPIVGDWKENIKKLPPSSINVSFVEPDLENVSLNDYSLIGSELDRILKPGSRAFVLVPQHHLPFVGKYLKTKDLMYGWTYTLWSESPLSIKGTVTCQVPMIFLYKPPYELVVRDTFIPIVNCNDISEIMSLQLKPKNSLEGLKTAVYNYLAQIVRKGDRFLYISTHNSHLGQIINKSAQEGKSKQVIQLIHN